MPDKNFTAQPARPPRGRGTGGNPHNRYQALRVEAIDETPDSPAASAVTECRAVRARSIISSNNSPDVPFHQSINPYQGCEHGCIYCYARPTHAYLDLSPGLDFETKLTRKVNAAEQLRTELARRSYRCEPITLGANTDPYQPVEAKYRITREILEVLERCDHPFTIITKGSLITRDLDILSRQAAKGLCSVAISITTLNADLKRRLEPRTASGAARLSVMKTLSDAGVPVTLLFAPLIPALNDAEMETVLDRAAAAGASAAAYILLRLPLEISALFQEWLSQHYPLKAEHVMSLLRQCRGGADSDSRFGHRMRGEGTFADLLSRRFRVQCRRLGLSSDDQRDLRRDLFRPAPQERNSSQFDLFS